MTTSFLSAAVWYSCCDCVGVTEMPVLDSSASEATLATTTGVKSRTGPAPVSTAVTRSTPGVGAHFLPSKSMTSRCVRLVTEAT